MPSRDRLGDLYPLKVMQRRTASMPMGRRHKQKQRSLFVPNTGATQGPRHRFYEALESLLRQAEFDQQVEELCEPFYDPDRTKGRHSVPPGVYFRMLLIGFFEGIESERGICWRCADSLSLKTFLGLEVDERVADHSTLSRTRQRLPEEVGRGLPAGVRPSTPHR